MTAPSRSPSQSEVINLGCRLNIAEAERMRAMLAQTKDVVVVNSCAVTSEAVRQTRQAIRKARRERPNARLIVTGCAADIERDALGAMEEVDGLVPNAAKLDPRSFNIPAEKAPLAPTKTRAFIAVQNGCDHACTFCVIPQGRGVSRSLAIANVLAEVEQHLELGAKEIVLTGVDLTSWGNDISNTPRLGDLVRTILDGFDQLKRLRLSSMDGIEVDPLLEDMIASETRIMPHIHLSLQHGADLILKRMKRRHLRGDAIALVERLKARRADIAVGADLMAGFPTENAAHHAENLSIIRKLDLVHAHIFPFSPRPGTPAARMPQLDRALIKSRAAELRAEVAKIREDWLKAHVGKAQSVLAERDGTGYAPDYARIALPENTPAGSIMSVTPKHLEGGLLK